MGGVDEIPHMERSMPIDRREMIQRYCEGFKIRCYYADRDPEKGEIFHIDLGL